MEARTVSRESHVRAVVDEVLPHTGLVYLTDDHAGNWTATRSTPGVDLQALRPGQRVDLTVVDYGDFCVASGFAPLD
jgi:hypothetical protein